jgi:hypothetical protein
MSTPLLTRSEVETLLDPVAIVPLLRDAFAADSADTGSRARRVFAPRPRLAAVPSQSRGG